MDINELEADLVALTAVSAGIDAALEAEAISSPAVAVVVAINAALSAAAKRLNAVDPDRLRAVIRALSDTASDDPAVVDRPPLRSVEDLPAGALELPGEGS